MNCSARTRMNRTTAYLSLLFLCCSAHCQAAPAHGHAEARTPDNCNQANQLPDVRCAATVDARFDGQGRLWISWAYAGHVYVQYSHGQGKPLSPAVSVNAVPEKIAAHGENRPKLAIAHNGNVYVSWTMKLDKRYTGHIRFSRTTDGGRHFSEPVTVNDHRGITSHRFDAITVNSRGEIYIAWLDKRDRVAHEARKQAYRGAALYYAYSSNEGKSFHQNRKIADYSCECCRVVMQTGPDQLPVILWRHIYDRNTRDHALVKFQASRKPGDIRRASVDDWQVDACPHHGPSLAISASGRYHITWFSRGQKHNGIFYAHSDDQGNTFSKSLPLGKNRTASHPHVLGLGTHIYIAWKEFDSEGGSIHATVSHDNGKSWSEPRLLASTKGDSDYPFLVTDGRQVYLSWHRPGEPFRLIPVNPLSK